MVMHGFRAAQARYDAMDDGYDAPAPCVACGHDFDDDNPHEVDGVCRECAHLARTVRSVAKRDGRETTQ